MTWAEVRALYPALETCTYLNTAGGAPLSKYAAAAGAQYYEEGLTQGDLLWDAWLARTEAVRHDLARFVGATPQEIAFLHNASIGINYVAHLLHKQGAVLAVRDEFPSNTLPWLQLGTQVQFVPSAPDGSVTVADFERVRTAATKTLIVSHVQFQTGFRHDLEALGHYCQTHGLHFIVDATQSFSAFPLDVAKQYIDVLVFSGYKWATAGYGIAGCYVGKPLLDPKQYPAVGWRSARQPYTLHNDRLDLTDAAVAFELGHPPFAGIFALGASLRLFTQLGASAMQARVLALTQYLHQRLLAAGFRMRSTRDPAHCSGITMLDVPDPQATVAALRKHNVIVTARGQGVRISVHVYNHEADIDRLVHVLQRIAC